MKTIVAGSRNNVTYDDVEEAIKLCGWDITTVISGTARGADYFGEQWAIKNGVSIEKYPADWNKFGKSAGYRRNVEMAENAEALVAVWDGESRGTQHMINIANDKKLRVFVLHKKNK